MIVILGLLTLLAVGFLMFYRPKYNRRGFDRKGIHKNGTRFDDYGYDVGGYDKNGFDYQGYDKDGYNHAGYSRHGYDRHGKNDKGQYNRLFDRHYTEDGFRDPHLYPIGTTNHAKERIMERMHICNEQDIPKIVLDAYSYGRSKRQLRRSSAALVEEIENQHERGTLLIYKGYIYIFSDDNKLITLYKNERIPL